MSETKIALPRTAAELEAMSAADINAAITELRRLQRESLPVPKFHFKPKSFLSTFPLDLNPPPVRFKHRSLGAPGIYEDGFAIDAKNLSEDMKRVGRGMWIAWLRIAPNRKRKSV